MPQFLTNNKTDFAFKYGQGILGTNPTWQWFSENSKNEVNVLIGRIWADTVPFAANFAQADSNDLSSPVVTKRTVTLTLQPSHNERLWRARVTPGDATSALYLDSISPLDVPDAAGNPSQGYSIRLYRDNGSGGLGTEILTTDGAWFWHYKLCALILDESHTATNEGWTQPLHVIFYQYTGNFGAGSSSLPDLSQTTLDYVAGDDLGGHRLITTDPFGLAIYADQSNLDHTNKVVGLTMNAADLGASVTVLIEGPITEPSWNWDTNLPVFLSTSGQMTQTPPTSGFSLIIGFPETSTRLMVRINRPIILV